MSIGQDAVTTILAEVIPEPVGAAVAILFAAQHYNAVDFCGQGDVGDPGMSAQDWSDAVDFTNPVVNLPARTKAQQWFQHIIFPVLCNCSDGSTPPTPVVTGPPSTGGPAGVPNSQIGTSCFDNTQTSMPSGLTWDASYMDIFPKIPTTIQKFPPPEGTPTPLPSGYVIKVTPGTEGATPFPAGGNINFFTSGGVLIQGFGTQWTNVQPGTTFTSALLPFPSNAAAWNMVAQPPTSAGDVLTNNVTHELIIYCGGQSPTAVSSPCCPPDPVVQGQLGAILQMLTELLSLQGLQGPYQDTVRHAGLSGNGTIAINPASSAIRVEVRTDLSTWPQNIQTPPYFYSLGFVTPFAVGTPLKGQRLVYDKQTFTWPSYTDTIGYSLAAGIVIDLVELTRGA